MHVPSIITNCGISFRRLVSGSIVFIFTVAVVTQSFYALFDVNAAVNGPQLPSTYSAVSGASTHTCGISSGAAYCWGTNTYGQLGNNSTRNTVTPVPVVMNGALSGKTVTAISAGPSHTCAVASGEAFCWGYNLVGQLGNNSTTQSTQPVAVSTSGVLSGKTVTDIAAGSGHTCVVASSAAYCWGSNLNGRLGNNSSSGNSLQPVAVVASGVLSGKTVTDVSAGVNNSCVVASNAAYCWGNNSNGRLGNNSTSQSLVPVTVTASGVLSGKTVTTISTNDGHTCAVASSAAYCWGSNTSGRLGNNSTTQSLVPVTVTASGVLSGKTVTAISTGTSFTCVAASSAAYCWGYNFNGQLGNNSTTQSLVPVTVTASGVLSGKTVTAISTGNSHTCAVATSAMYCWGYNFFGQLGNNNNSQSNVPTAVLTGYLFDPIANASSRFFNNNNGLQPGSPLAGLNQTASVSTGDAFRLRTGVLGGQGTNALTSKTVTAIAAGVSHTCAIAEGAAYCWGQNANGQVGNDSLEQTIPTPVAVDTTGLLAGKTVTDISAGSSHTCAVADGAAYCWGLNEYGQLGDNYYDYSSKVPVAVDTTGVLAGKTVTAISAGNAHTCAVADGAAYCWGDNWTGQLGDNSSNYFSLVPVAVDTTGVLAGKTVSAITVGYSHSCGVANGAAYCWGNNDFSQLGDVSTNPSPYAVAVDTSGILGGKTITAISAGYDFTCAIGNSAAYCWGNNQNGQLGDNYSATFPSIPVAVDTSGVLSGKVVTAVSSNGYQACVVASGATYCWGNNDYGQLGDDSVLQALVPVAVDTAGVLSGKTSTRVAMGAYHACTIADGSVSCWGYNDQRQIGDNTGDQHLVPVRTAALDDWVELVASLNSFSLRFAEKTSATCSAQTTGFAAVNGSTAIAWNTNSSATDGSQISQNANDPTLADSTVYQSYESNGTSFTNTNNIAPGKLGLWDFSLKETDGTPKSYCLKITYADGSDLENYEHYPEITVTGSNLSLGFIDENDAPIAVPMLSMASKNMLSVCQSTTGTLGTSSGSRLRLTQTGSTANGWTVSIAAKSGATDSWHDTSTDERYDYNDPSGSPAGCNSGSDGDGLAGQLSVDTATTSIAPESECSTTGFSWNNGLISFSQGSVDAITLVSASSAAQADCYWDISNTQLSQTIPASQEAGEYQIQLTVTVVAQ